MDDRFRRANPATRAPIQQSPGDYFDTNIASTFITDRYGILNRHHIGVTQMMWSSDFPHGGSDWPDSLTTINKLTSMGFLTTNATPSWPAMPCASTDRK